MDDDARGNGRITRFLLLLAAALFLVLAAVYSESAISLFDRNPPLHPLVAEGVQRSRACYLLLGLILLLLSHIVRRTPKPPPLLAAPAAPKVLMAVLIVLAPLIVVELAFRPKAIEKAKTTLFLRDPNRGWKLKAGSHVWGGVHVRINAKGVRGPELAYAKPQGVRRILFLGDSVTFGFRLNYDDTFPYLIERNLRYFSPARVQVINAGVGGYSPWQERIYLEEEGMRYDPDLVVVSFVLNDVTENLGLTRFGGPGEGHQLRRTVGSRIEHLAETSGLVYFARCVCARVRFGANVAEGASREEVRRVRVLSEAPDDPGIRDAWRITLDNLDGIFGLCHERGVEAVLVVFPYSIQLTSSCGSIPQKVLEQYAAEKGIRLIDLLPALAERMQSDSLKAEELFIDHNHPTALGSRVVSHILTAWIQRSGLIDVE